MFLIFHLSRFLDDEEKAAILFLFIFLPLVSTDLSRQPYEPFVCTRSPPPPGFSKLIVLFNMDQNHKQFFRMHEFLSDEFPLNKEIIAKADVFTRIHKNDESTLPTKGLLCFAWIFHGNQSIPDEPRANVLKTINDIKMDCQGYKCYVVAIFGPDSLNVNLISFALFQNLFQYTFDGSTLLDNRKFMRTQRNLACERCFRHGGGNWELVRIINETMKFFGWTKAFYLYSSELHRVGSLMKYNNCADLLKLLVDETDLEIDSSDVTDRWENLNDVFNKRVGSRFAIVIVCASRRQMREVVKAADNLEFFYGEYVFFDLISWDHGEKIEYPWIEQDEEADQVVESADNDSKLKRVYESILRITVTPESPAYNVTSWDRTTQAVSLSLRAIAILSERCGLRVTDDGSFGATLSFHNRSCSVIIDEERLNEVGFRQKTRLRSNGDFAVEYGLFAMNKPEGKFTRALTFLFDYDEEDDYYSNISTVPAKNLGFLFPAFEYSVPPDVPKCGIGNRNCLIWPYVVGGVIALLALLVVCLAAYRKRILVSVHKPKWIIEKENLKFEKPKITEEITDKNKDITASSKSTSWISDGTPKPCLNRPNEKSLPHEFIKTAIYEGRIVAVKPRVLTKYLVHLIKPLDIHFCQSMSRDFIGYLIGYCFDTVPGYVVMEYLPRGSVQNVLHDFPVLDTRIKVSMAHDIAMALRYLHDTVKIPHGRLRSTSCLVDVNFFVKLSAFEPELLKWNGWDFISHQDYFSAEGNLRERSSISSWFKEHGKKLLWICPELLRDLNKKGIFAVIPKKNRGQSKSDLNITYEGDIYSFGIIMHEIFEHKGVFYTKKKLSVQAILQKILFPEEKYFRPVFTDIFDNSKLNPIFSFAQKCWSERPFLRPTASQACSFLRSLEGRKRLYDTLLSRMDYFSQHLDESVVQKKKEYLLKKKKLELLIHNMLPPRVASQLLSGKKVHTEWHERVTILCSDIVNYTRFSSGLSPEQVITILNFLYTRLDHLVKKHDLYKIDTIGDSYIVAAGVPTADSKGAQNVAKFALAMLEIVYRFVIRNIDGKTDFHSIQIRVGIHTGPVVAGVIGRKVPKYSLFGKGMEMAQKMESTGEPMMAQVSLETWEILKNKKCFHFEERSPKVGAKETYWLYVSPDHSAEVYEWGCIPEICHEGTDNLVYDLAEYNVSKTKSKFWGSENSQIPKFVIESASDETNKESAEDMAV